MKNARLSSAYVFFMVMLLFVACHNKPVTPHFTFKKLDSLEADSINKVITAEPKPGNKFLALDAGGKGEIWRLWKSLYKNCQNNQVANNMIYFGVSNTLGIGTVINSDSHGNLNADFPLLKEKLDSNQIKLIYNEGNPADCSFQRQTSVGVTFLAQSQFSSAANVNINAAIDNSKSITAKIDSWKTNNLYPGGLATVLGDTTNEYLKQYKNRLNNPQHYIISTEIEINGFSATITTKTSISADLRAQLQKGIIENVGNTAAQVKFSYVNDNTIKMSTIGAFMVFCSLIKASEVK